MNILLSISLLIRVTALGYSMFLLKRVKDRRVAVVIAICCLMVATGARDSWNSWARMDAYAVVLIFEGRDIARFIISPLAFMAIYLIGQLLIEQAQFAQTLLQKTQLLADRIATGKKAESALRESEAKFRFIAEQSIVGIFTGQNGAITYCNEAAEQITGYTLADVQQWENYGFIQHVVHPEDRERAVERAGRALAKETLEPEFECRILRKDGETAWIALHTSLDSNAQDVKLLTVLIDITERKRAEHALNLSQRNYQFYYDNTPVMMHSLDTEGRILSVNAFWEKSMGYAREEVLGQKITNFLSKASAQETVERRMPLLLEKGHITDSSAQMIKKSGALMEVMVTAIMGRDSLHSERNSLAFLIDVTEKKRAEERKVARLARSRARQEHLLELATHDHVKSGDLESAASVFTEMIVRELDVECASVWLYESDSKSLITLDWFVNGTGHTKRDGRISFVENPRFAESMQAERTQAVTDTLTDPRTVELAQSFSSMQIRSMLGVPVWVDGKMSALLMASRPNVCEEWEESDIAFVAEVGNQWAQAYINWQRRREQEMLMNIAMGVSAKTGTTFFADLVEHLANALEGECAYIAELVEDREDCIRTIAIFSAGQIQDNTEFPLAGTVSSLTLREKLCTYEDGVQEVFPQDLLLKATRARGYVGVSLQNAAGDDVGIIAILFQGLFENPNLAESMLRIVGARAVAELERLRADASLRNLNEELEERVALRTAQLEATNEELEAFSYSVSHDLRAPLRAINGFSQALTEDYGGLLDETASDYLDRVLTASRRMSSIIDDLLGLSKISLRQMISKKVDLAAMFQAINDEFQVLNSDTSVDVVCEGPIWVQGDPNLLHIALQNLIENAWKFSNGPNPRIEFGIEHNKGVKTYVLKDNGVGFEMAFVDRLFSPFQRLHSESEFPGTGVGLATVQRIIARHGGKIWADSVVGVGASFSFTLGPSPVTNDRATRVT